MTCSALESPGMASESVEATGTGALSEIMGLFWLFIQIHRSFTSGIFKDIVYHTSSSRIPGLIFWDFNLNFMNLNVYLSSTIYHFWSHLG